MYASFGWPVGWTLVVFGFAAACVPGWYDPLKLLPPVPENESGIQLECETLVRE